MARRAFPRVFPKMSGLDVPEDVSAAVAGWFPVLTEARTLEPFLLFAAYLVGSLEACAAFLSQCDEREALTPELEEARAAARAIFVELSRERDGKPPLNPWLKRPGLEPHFLELLKRGPTVGRTMMCGAYVGRALERCETLLALCEARADTESLGWAAEAVRILASQPKFSTGNSGMSEEPEQVRGFLPWPRLSVLCGVAAAIIAIAAASCFYVMQGSGWQAYATKVGGYSSVELADGSSFELNTNSVVRYRAASREAHLELGEARFKVVHDEARVFTVYAGDLVIRDVGTEFSVRLREDGKVEVRVSEGEVSVHRRKKQSVLLDLLPSKPPLSGEGTHVRAEHKVTHDHGRLLLEEISIAEIQDLEAWRNGEIFFSGMSLANVVNELNRYSERKIRIADRALGAVVLGGRLEFNPRDLEGTLNKLKRAAPIRVLTEGGSAEVIVEDARLPRARAGR